MSLPSQSHRLIDIHRFVLEVDLKFILTVITALPILPILGQLRSSGVQKDLPLSN
jgi:hypothetical protein